MAQQTKMDYLNQYAGGWGSGDTKEIESSTANGYVFNDPDSKVSRDQFADYHRSFMEKYGSTMAISGVVAYEVGDKLIACCVWEAGEVRGTGLITVSDEGVEREDVVILS